MKLRNKVTLILLASWCIIIAATYAGSKWVLTKSYLDLEHKNAIVSMQRVDQAIDQLSQALETLSATWSNWDDAYLFVEDLNPKFIQTNLVVGSFESANIDDILFYNPAGKMVYGMAVNHTHDREIPVSGALLDYLSPQGALLANKDINQKIRGLAVVPSGLMFMVARPILASDNSGPAHGTLVMTRIITPATVAYIKELTKNNVDIYPVNNIAPASQLDHVYRSVLANNDLEIVAASDDFLNGYLVLRDIYQQPAALVKTVLPRTIYQNGLTTLRYYNVLFTSYSLVLLVLVWVLMQKLLVVRLENLKGNISSTNLKSISHSNHRYEDEVTTIEDLYHKATHDPLTGLANRSLLEQAFQNAMAVTKDKQAKIVLMYLDIDNFKRVNDTLGHEIGDELLTYIAGQLNASLRDHDLAVRLGGDEFLVLLTNINANEIANVVHRVFESVSQSIRIKQHDIYLTTSIGVSVYPDNGKDIKALMNQADIALYHAKENGRNHYQFYSTELNLSLQEAHRKEVELQKAIDNKELCLFYQPIYDVLTKRMISIEALIRWHHPQRGLLSASEVIPVAEKSGLIIPIGKWALTTACRQAKQWQEMGLPKVPVAVNISILQTKSTSLFRVITDALNNSQLDPHYLELELTETSYIDLTDSIVSDLHKLSDLGVGLVVDDFGAGYSGLGYLRKLPITKLKIDRSFIKDIVTDPDANAITLAVIAIAHQLDLLVVAEGVETIAHFEFLKLNHVDAAQGNYFSKPIDPEKFEALLKTYSQDASIKYLHDEEK